MKGTLAHRRPSTRTRTAVVGLLAAAALTACSSGATSSGGSSSTSAAPAGGSATSAAPAAGSGGSSNISIFVVGGKSDDPFWSKVKRGVDDAAKVVEAAGGKVTWLGPQNYDNLGPDAAKLILSAKSQGATALIGADWVPDAQNQAFKTLTDAGIPVFLYNAGGVTEAKNIGALSYVGSEEELAGKAGGEFFGTNGAKNVLCVNTLPGAANTEARCKGVSEGISASGGKSSQLPLPSSNFGNPTAVTQAIKAALLKDPSIDGVVTIATQDADSAAAAIDQAEATGKVKLGTFDMDDNQLSRIKDGKQLFCIDQQPYLQGYLAVSQAYAYNAYGLRVAQESVLTGPAIVSKDNVDAAISGVKAGVR
ncbi:sugar ABC transporter substrate-binding protein [Kineosporia sp. R_H_3]|uniref:sugar ABC transporter substrate-binding protein n=1 Tax=Kineosporia sp. R_H_3 TaxID=1961848 RepID=UPI000B4B9D60|nr:sugar ABC transporter substrate-binding protein [Kineosporia sp. R_H_3]